MFFYSFFKSWSLGNRVDELEAQLKKLQHGTGPSLSAEDSAPLPVKEKGPAPSTQVPVKAAAVSSPKMREDFLPAKELRKEALVKVDATQILPTTKSAQPQEESAPRINWESFTAAKVFSWVGGFTLFLAIVFCIKYAIDKDLLTPAMRIGLVALAGAGLLMAGFWIRKPSLRTTANTLMGCGLAVLYIDVFVSYSYYQMISMSVSFGLMAVLSLCSFAIAVWKEAKYIGFLAVIISFFTPFLLSGEKANIPFFLGYLALVNAASWWASLSRSWNGLLNTTVCFTALSQFYVFIGLIMHKDFPDTLSFCLFGFVYCAVAVWGRKWKQKLLQERTRHFLLGYVVYNLFFVCAAMGFWGAYLAHSIPFLALGLGLNLLLGYVACQDESSDSYYFIAGKILVAVAIWILAAVLPKEGFIGIELGTILAFAAINIGTDLRIYRKKKMSISGLPVFILALMLPAFIQFNAAIFSTFALWVCLLLVLFAGIVACTMITKNKLPAFAAAFALLIYLLAFQERWPSEITYSLFLWGSGLLPMILCAGICFLFRNKIPQDKGNFSLVFGCAFLPYILLLASVGNAISLHWVFGFVLLLNLLVSFFVWLYQEPRPLWAALGGSLLLEIMYMGNAPVGVEWFPFLVWVSFLWVPFFLFPLLFGKERFPHITSWAVSSLAGVGSGLVFTGVFSWEMKVAHPGMVPFAVAILYGLSLWRIKGWALFTQPEQQKRLVWISATILFFLTLILPLELGKAALTCALALEGFALVLLNRKFPFKGLRGTGFALLVLVFTRLVLNPFVWTYYHPQGKIFNWYLYVFGLAGASMLLSARYWKPKEEALPKSYLQALGGIILFVLMNVEIAHYFSPVEGLRFNLLGDFGSAITYTVAWSIFGAGCIFLGLYKQVPFVRKVGLVLIGAALFKLFLFDIWLLETLYRIIGLFGVAAVLMWVSFVYQRLRKTS